MTEASPLNRYQLAELGFLLAEPARAAILLTLMDGTTRPAGELARIAGVSPATASAHLKRLLDGGLLGLHEQGRHRYFRLANDDVAAWLEAMALPHAARSVPVTATRDVALCRARTCYRHLAGQLGVALCDAWLQRGWLHSGSDGLSLLPAATEALVRAGWQAGSTQQLLHLRGRGCLDWTERRLHIGGPLGVAITSAMLEAGWLRHAQRSRSFAADAGWFASIGRARDALIHSARASPVLSVRRPQGRRRRQTGRLSRRRTEGLRTDRTGPNVLHLK